MREFVLHQDALGEALHPKLTQITLEATHHDRREVLFALHIHATREAILVEQLQERTEAI